MAVTGWRKKQPLNPSSPVQVFIPEYEVAELTRRNEGQTARLGGEPKLEGGSATGALNKLLVMHTRVVFPPNH